MNQYSYFKDIHINIRNGLHIVNLHRFSLYSFTSYFALKAGKPERHK